MAAQETKHVHLAGFTLVPANRDQVLLSRKRQTIWRRGMTEAQFMDREAQLEKLEHASDGNLIVWALVPRDDPQTLEFRCSCETFRRRALVAKPSASPEEVISYGIASVFCPPEYRRCGYASHMMRLLHHVMSPSGSLPPFPQEWGAPPTSYADAERNARFSVLYSDVGEFYKYCGPSLDVSGWHIRSPISTTWEVKPEGARHTDVLEKNFELLSEEQCRVLWEADTTYLTSYFSQLSPSPHTRFTFLPNNGLAAFLLHRSVAESPLHPNPKAMEHWGVSIPQKAGSPPVYATWTLELSLGIPPVLVVTRMRVTAESFHALLEALEIAARQVGANVMEVWNLQAGLVDVATNLGGKTMIREEHLPAVAWYGSEHPDEVEWAFNEKFAWC